MLKHIMRSELAMICVAFLVVISVFTFAILFTE